MSHNLTQGQRDEFDFELKKQMIFGEICGVVLWK
jgi:hypothetical protein